LTVISTGAVVVVLDIDVWIFTPLE